MRARAEITVSGRVQGVYYRGFTKDVADELGLSGWVRNMPDGGVEAVFEGDKEVIETAISKCRQGPPAAVVTDIDVRWSEALEDVKGFSIRYY